eukprot:7737564-Pyramimonas_sp.AAC.1
MRHASSTADVCLAKCRSPAADDLPIASTAMETSESLKTNIRLRHILVDLEACLSRPQRSATRGCCCARPSPTR